MKDNNLYSAIKTKYLIDEFAKQTEDNIHNLLKTYNRESSIIIGSFPCEYKVKLKYLGDIIEDYYLNENDLDEIGIYYKNLFVEFPELKNIPYFELEPLEDESKEDNYIYVYNGKIYTNDWELFDDLEYEYEYYVEDIYHIKNIEKWKKIHQVPSNVILEEPLNYGKVFESNDVRNNILSILCLYPDTRITFEDDKTYMLMGYSENKTFNLDLFTKMEKYKVPCSKAKKIIIDEFERECHVIFEKKSDYFDEQYLKVK